MTTPRLISHQRLSIGAAAVVILSLLVACDDDSTLFKPPHPDLPDEFCCPSWLGSDSLVVYRAEGLSGNRQQGLWVSPLDGSEPWLCLAGDVNAPSYSSVAGKLAFEANAQILVADLVNSVADTLSILQVTTNGASFFPSWSPDGEWIAHDRRYCDLGGGEEDTTCGVFAVRPSGSESRFITQGIYPIWLPDGTGIVFSLRGEVYGIDFPSRENLRQLSSFHSVFNPPRALGRLTISPDGTTILVEIRTRPEPTLWLLPSVGGAPSRLLEGRWPSWSPSGLLAAFIMYGDSDPGRNGTVWLYCFDSGNARQFTRR